MGPKIKARWDTNFEQCKQTLGNNPALKKNGTEMEGTSEGRFGKFTLKKKKKKIGNPG